MQPSEVLNTRTGVGAGIGAVIGFAFGGPVGAGAGALLGGAIAHTSGEAPKGEMTPRRKLIFARAMEAVKDPQELSKLADAFAGEGLPGPAAMLRKRAGLRELPPEVQAKRRAAFRKAMASDNPEVIRSVATAFENVGSIDAAKVLRDHADAVVAAHAAGKSAKPMTGGTVAQFADKLGKAIIHFGPDSGQAKAAARNLIQARGKPPTDALIVEVIRIASAALQAPQTAQEAAAAPEEVGPPPGIDQEGAPRGAVEATVVGPPASKVEAQAISSGTPVPQPPVAEAAPEPIEEPIGDVIERAQEAKETAVAESDMEHADDPPAPHISEVAASADDSPGGPGEMVEAVLGVPSNGEEELQ